MARPNFYVVRQGSFGWETIQSDGTVVARHATEKQAIDQAHNNGGTVIDQFAHEVPEPEPEEAYYDLVE